MESTQDQNTNTNKWADLPADILTRILKHLDLKTDLTRLRGVCPSWRSAPPLNEHPIHASHIQVPNLDDINDDLPLFLIETRFVYFKPINSNSGGWIARMGQIGPNKWRLLNPIPNYAKESSDTNLYRCIYTEPPISGEINLLDCRVFNLGKAMILNNKLDFNAKPISEKVVGQWDTTSSSPSVILAKLYEDGGHWFYTREAKANRLLLLRSKYQKWVKIDLKEKSNNFMVLDIAYQNGIFFVFRLASNRRWEVGIIDPNDSTILLKPFISGISHDIVLNAHLVSSESNRSSLYLVARTERSYSGNHKMLVYFINEGKQETNQNLRDEILFYSTFISFSIKSSLLFNNNNNNNNNNNILIFRFLSNSRVFKKYTYDVYKDKFPKMPNGAECLREVRYMYYNRYLRFYFIKEIRDIDHNQFGSVFVFDDERKYRVIHLDEIPKEERKFYTELFFPTPSWVKCRCPSVDNVEVKLNGFRFNDSDYYHDADHDHYDYEDFDDAEYKKWRDWPNLSESEDSD